MQTHRTCKFTEPPVLTYLTYLTDFAEPAKLAQLTKLIKLTQLAELGSVSQVTVSKENNTSYIGKAHMPQQVCAMSDSNEINMFIS